MLCQNDFDFLKAHLPFWDRLSDDEREMLHAGTKLIEYKEGDNVYSAVNECIGVLLVKSGELRTYILSEDGREVTLYRLKEGTICVMSASCLIHNITFDVSIDAEKDTRMLLIDASIFAKLQDDNEFVENFALKLTTDRFSDVMWVMEQMLFMSFDKRLAIFLLDETSKTGSDKLPLTHEKIAQYMGSAREVVSRMLKYFEKEGLVSLSRGGVEILDIEALRSLSI